MKEYEKNTVGILDMLRIREIANSSDEVISMFEKTPIHKALIARREYARVLLDKVQITEDNVRMLGFYDNNIREFFLI